MYQILASFIFRKKNILVPFGSIAVIICAAQPRYWSICSLLGSSTGKVGPHSAENRVYPGLQHVELDREGHFLNPLFQGSSISESLWIKHGFNASDRKGATPWP